MDIDSILAPIPGDNPSGENLRYTSVYDKIQDARRADDLLEQGEWQHEVKKSDWSAVFTLANEALTTRTKDLQIAAWLMEALTVTKGFYGVSQGLTVISRLLSEFWDSIYPQIEEDDLEYRAGPLEFINDKLWLPIKQAPLTDPSKTPGYSWMKWQESRQVGSEKDILNSYGDVDDTKQKLREAQIAEGKISAEEFDAAVNSSSRAYYETLLEHVTLCMERFLEIDKFVDETFGRDAPRLAELKTSLEDCLTLVSKFVRVKREKEPDPLPEALAEELDALPGEGDGGNFTDTPDPIQAQEHRAIVGTPPVGNYHVNRILGSAGIEEAVWQDALKKFAKEGIRPALEQLLGASCSAQSVREKTNFRLLMAKLCLRANRPDLARPIMEELNTLIDTLQLEAWESPIWIAETLGTLYQCLTAEGASEDDHYRANDLLTRLCTLDITRAMAYSSTEND